jgi:hypothetical protein
MCPPDPHADEAPAGEEEPEELALPDLATLRAAGDMEGLLAAAKAYRSGKAPGGRDMNKCFEAYAAAAELGSPDAEYAGALFYLNGGVVPQDLKEGATRLRAAAEKGSLPARVYLGNLYELGIHYRADPEKADVWYRNAARAARVDATPGSEAWSRRLAELGCARYVLALVESGAASEEERPRLLARAKAHGFGLRIRSEADEAERLTFEGSLVTAEDAAAESSRAPKTGDAASILAETDDAEPAAEDAPGKARRPRSQTLPATPAAKKSGGEGAPTQVALGLAAFGYAVLFAATGTGAGYAATVGARELVLRGGALPLLGTRVDLVFPIVLLALGIVPAWLVYRLTAMVKALVAGAAFAGVGWVAWGTGQGVIHQDRAVQAIAFALAGCLAALLVLGILGGTKKRPAR